MESYVVIEKDMASLGLKGSELVIYAVIASYTKTLGGYSGSLKGLSEWAGTTKQGTMKCLSKLEGKGLVEKIKTACGKPTYKAVNKVDPKVNKVDLGVNKVDPDNISNNIDDKLINNDKLINGIPKGNACTLTRPLIRAGYVENGSYESEEIEGWLRQTADAVGLDDVRQAVSYLAGRKPEGEMLNPVAYVISATERNLARIEGIREWRRKA